MHKLDQELYNLKMDVLQKHHLEARMESLVAQKTELEQKVMELEQYMRKEQADVAKLEQNSLSRLWHVVINNLDETLEREQAEAYEAALKHDMAQKELLAVAEDIVRTGEELDVLAHSETKYETVLMHKLERVKLENPAYGAEILRMEALIGEQELYIRELQESIDAGYHALDAATAVLLELDDAENIAMMDVFLNGGLLAAFAKRSRLERAQQKLEVLQAQLRSFKTELADVKFDADLQMELDGLTYFADWFFDCLIMDGMIVNEISKRKDKLVGIKRQIYAIMTGLEARKGETERLHMELIAARNKLVVEY